MREYRILAPIHITIAVVVKVYGWYTYSREQARKSKGHKNAR